jgi:YebC/PmpR family DNA-binding regulatory protein
MMSGHSKWHNIKVKKEKTDKVRSKLFGKLAREIMVVAREGGSNPDGNARLRTAIERARASGLPSDNIQRAIQRGAGELEGANYEAITYEGYAPGGVAVLLDVLTDNRNRTAAEVRLIFTKYGGALGGGSVAWMFERQGLIALAAGAHTEDDVTLAAIEAGGEDVRAIDDGFEVVAKPEQTFKVKQALEALGYTVTGAQTTMHPRNTVRVEGKQAERVLRLMEALEDHDDVQAVHANFDIPDEIMQQVG